MSGRDRGVTLLELMVVLAILVILASFVIPALGEWKRKYDVEHTIKLLYTALNEARLRAFDEKRVCGLVWSGSSFSSISLKCDTDGDGQIIDDADNGTEEIWSKDLKVTLSENLANNYCRFNYKGFAFSPSDQGTFRYTDTSVDAEYSCVRVSLTRIKMGKWDGSTCQLK